MKIEFDPAKDLENKKKHGVSLELAEEFDPDKLITRTDDRFNYGEMREVGLGLIKKTCLCSDLYAAQQDQAHYQPSESQQKGNGDLP